MNVFALARESPGEFAGTIKGVLVTAEYLRPKDRWAIYYGDDKPGIFFDRHEEDGEVNTWMRRRPDGVSAIVLPEDAPCALIVTCSLEQWEAIGSLLERPSWNIREVALGAVENAKEYRQTDFTDERAATECDQLAAAAAGFSVLRAEAIRVYWSSVRDEMQKILSGVAGSENQKKAISA